MMLVDTKNIMSLTEANQNFSRVVKAVDDKGAVVISKNNIPRYVVIDIKHVRGSKGRQRYGCGAKCVA